MKHRSPVPAPRAPNLERLARPLRDEDLLTDYPGRGDTMLTYTLRLRDEDDELVVTARMVGVVPSVVPTKEA